MNWILKGMVIGGGLVFGAAILGNVASRNAPRAQAAASAPQTPRPPDPLDVARARARVGARSLKSAMRDPDSFVLDSAIINTTWTTCFEYRAKNGFGGYNRDMALLEKNGRGVLLSSASGFRKKWNHLCAGKDGTDYTKEIRPFL